MLCSKGVSSLAGHSASGLQSDAHGRRRKLFTAGVASSSRGAKRNPWGHLRMLNRVRAVCVLSSDVVFQREVHGVLISKSTATLRELEDELRRFYPTIRVRPRDLSGEPGLTWTQTRPCWLIKPRLSGRRDTQGAAPASRVRAVLHPDRNGQGPSRPTQSAALAVMLDVAPRHPQGGCDGRGSRRSAAAGHRTRTPDR
jgi:hypothetical protein